MTASTDPRAPRRARAARLTARVLRFPLTRIVIAVPWLLACSELPRLFHLKGMFVSVPLGGSAVVGGYLTYVRVVENRQVTELSLRGAARELGAGLLLGSVLFTATIGVIWAVGDYTVTAVNPWAAALPALVIAFVSGTVEEIIFRGLIFRVVEEGVGSWLALALTALLFGALHLANPHATLVAGVAIALEAGVLLGAAFMATRRLWLPIGLHVAWNFTQAGVFGVAESGNEIGGWLVSRLTGPAWLSGGAFGAEASLPAVVVCLVAGVYLARRAATRGLVVRPAWRAETPAGMAAPR
jgi:membrane protease YdiL (CAAX protease family)